MWVLAFPIARCVFMTFSVHTRSVLVKLESGGCDQLEIDLLLACSGFSHGIEKFPCLLSLRCSPSLSISDKMWYDATCGLGLVTFALAWL